MNPAQINSFIKAANDLKAGNYLEETSKGFQTTTNAAKGIPLDKIKEIATQCLTALKKEKDSTKVQSLVTGLKNLEEQLKVTNCFSEIYKAASKSSSPFDRLPHVLMDKTLEYESPKDWAMIEQFSHLFKNATTRAKVWEKEAKRLHLDVEPQKAKEAVLEFYHFLPDLNKLLVFSSEENQRLDGITSTPIERFQEIEKTWERQSIPIWGYIKGINDDSLSKREHEANMHVILWGFRTGHVTEDNLLSYFTEIATIKTPEIRYRLLYKAIKYLPQFESNKDVRLLRGYFSLKGEYIDMDLAERLVDKFDHITSQGSAFSIISMVSNLFKKDLAKCQALLRKVIQKGDRLLSNDQALIPEEMKKFIADEISKADAAKK